MWTTVLKVLGGLGIVAALAFVIQWVRGAAVNKAALGQADLALEVESKRVTAMEAAAAEERVKRSKALDEKIAAVDSAGAAADLLRSELSAARGAPAPRPLQDPTKAGTAGP